MKMHVLKAGLLMGIFCAAPAFAQFTAIATPTAAYKAGTTLMSIPGAIFSTKTSLTDGTETLSFSSTLDVRTVPSGGWATWNSPPAVESATPTVLGAISVTSLTISLAPARATFGFELEPNGPGTFAMTVTFFNGGTTLGSIPLSINATSGALVAAASSGTPITSVTITAPGGAGGFAMAQFRYGSSIIGAPIPTLGLPGLSALGMALLAGGALLARRQNLDRA
jgi:hypothetical protein